MEHFFEYEVKFKYWVEYFYSPIAYIKVSVAVVKKDLLSALIPNVSPIV